MSEKIFQWQMTELNKPFQLAESVFPELNIGEVLVKIAGCGVCHTDISFWHHGVQTKHALPLTLGHEISGTVIAGDKEWIGKNVIILQFFHVENVIYAKTTEAIFAEIN